MYKIKSIFYKIYNSPERVFVVLAVVFGLFSIVTIPPFDKNDEPANFIRAYGISNGEFYVDDGGVWPGYNVDGVRSDGGVSGTVTIPTSYRKSRQCLGIGGSYPWMTKAPIEQNKDMSYKDISRVPYCAFSNPLDESSQEHLVGNAPYSPISYVPQVTAILIGKLIDAPILVMSYMVRVFNLALWVTLTVFAIKMIPRRKWTVAFVSLFPAFIYSIAHATPDATLFGSMVVFFAVIMRSIYLPRAMFNKEEKKLRLILLVAAVVMVLAKSSYGVLFLPLMLFYGGIGKFRTVKIIVMILLALLSFSAANDWQSGEELSSQSPGIKAIVKEFPKTVAVQLIKGESVSPGMFSGVLVLPNLPQVWITMLASMMMILILAIGYEKRNTAPWLVQENKERRLLIFVGVVISCLVFCGALFLLWKQFGYIKPVPLVPGRYFLSIITLFAMLPIINKISSKESDYKRICISGLLILNVVVIASYVYGRYMQ